jgi:predicted GNAT family acetyltransferase
MELIYEKDNQRAALYDAGKLIGECDYELEDDHWVITHTFVEKAYGGQGLARKLVNTLIEEARKEQIRIKPVCSYAVKVLSDQIYDDVRR